MSAMQAALGRSQLRRIEALAARKREIGCMYQELLGDIEEFTLPSDMNRLGLNSYWVFGVLVNPNFMDGNQMRAKLDQFKVGTRPFFCPMHLQPVLQPYLQQDKSNFPVASMLWEQGFYLPSGVGMTDSQILEVSKRVHEVVKS